MSREAEIEAYAKKLAVWDLLVARACWRLADKQKEVGLTPEEEEAARSLGHCRTHLDAQLQALSFFRGIAPTPRPNGTLAQVLTALGEDQYKGQGGPLSERQQVVARLARYETTRAKSVFDAPTEDVKPVLEQLSLFR